MTLAAGSGKTHTMVGDQTDPGLMVLSLRDVFRFIERDSEHKDYIVECSYTEVRPGIKHNTYCAGAHINTVTPRRHR